MSSRTVFLALSVTGAFLLGNLSGFALGMATVDELRGFFAGLFALERPAALSDPQRLAGQRYSLEFTSNWSLDVDDPSYDPDYFFSIDTPGACYVLFELVDHEPEAERYLRDWIDYFRPGLSRAEEEAFAAWGPYAGQGVRLRGRYHGNFTHIDVFVHAAGERSFGVVESCYEDDLAMVEPGFAMVRSSFRLDAAPPRSGRPATAASAPSS